MSDTMPAPLSESEVDRVIVEAVKHAGPDGCTAQELTRATELLELMVIHELLITSWRDGTLEVGYDRLGDTLVWHAVDQSNV